MPLAPWDDTPPWEEDDTPPWERSSWASRFAREAREIPGELGRAGRAFGAGMLDLVKLPLQAAEVIGENPMLAGPLGALGAIAPWRQAATDRVKLGLHAVDAVRSQVAPPDEGLSFTERLREDPIAASIEGIAGTAPQLAATTGLAVGTGGVAPALFGAASMGLPAYHEARGEGVGRGKALAGAGLEAAAGAALEPLSGKYIAGLLKQRAASALKSMGVAGITEAATEVGQEGVDILRQLAQGIDIGDPAQRLWAAGYLGLVGGGAGAGAARLAGPAAADTTAPQSPLRPKPAPVDAALEAARLEARTDRLTGLRNRRAFDEEAPQYRAIGYIDLDGLKAINDRFGHEAGDVFLRSIADLARKHGVDDRSFRDEGSDEFLLGARDEAEEAGLGEQLDTLRRELEESTLRITDRQGRRQLYRDFKSFSYGIGPDLRTAESRAAADKQARKDAGLAPERGRFDRQPVAGAGPSGPDPGGVEGGDRPRRGSDRGRAAQPQGVPRVSPLRGKQSSTLAKLTTLERAYLLGGAQNARERVVAASRLRSRGLAGEDVESTLTSDGQKIADLLRQDETRPRPMSEFDMTPPKMKRGEEPTEHLVRGATFFEAPDQSYVLPGVSKSRAASRAKALEMTGYDAHLRAEMEAIEAGLAAGEDLKPVVSTGHRGGEYLWLSDGTPVRADAYRRAMAPTVARPKDRVSRVVRVPHLDRLALVHADGRVIGLLGVPPDPGPTPPGLTARPVETFDADERPLGEGEEVDGDTSFDVFENGGEYGGLGQPRLPGAAVESRSPLRGPVKTPHFQTNIATQLDDPKLAATIERDADAIAAKIGGRVTWNETAEAARALRLKPDHFMRLNPKFAKLSKEHKMRLSMELAGARKREDALLARVDTAEATPAELGELAGLQEEIPHKLLVSIGAGSEMGRALNSLKAAIREGMTPRQRFQTELLRRYRDKIEANPGLVAMIAQADPNDAEGVAALMREAGADEPFRNFLEEYWRTNVLSGPGTQQRNTIGGIMQTFSENLVAPSARALLSAVKHPINHAARLTSTEDVSAGLRAIPGAHRAAAKAAGEAFRQGELSPDKLSSGQFGNAMLWQRFKSPLARSVAKKFQLPVRAMQASDTYFRTLSVAAERSRLATADARREGLRGDALDARAQEIITENRPEHLTKAKEFGEKVSMTDDATNIARAILSLRNKGGSPNAPPNALNQSIGFLRHTVAPFVQIADRMLARGKEWSPLGWKKAFETADPEQREDLMARAAVGSAITAVAGALAAAGNLTGAAPEDAEERERFYRSGKQPWSMRVGDRWYPYVQLGPMMMPVALVATAYDGWKAGGDEKSVAKAAWAASMAVPKFMLEQSYLSALGDWFEALGGKEGSLKKLAAGVLGGLNPWSGAQRAAAITIDPRVTDAKTVPQKIAAGIPGLSESVPGRLDVYGEEQIRAGGRRSGIVAGGLPFLSTKVKSDPVDEAANLSGATTGYAGKTLTGVKLTDEQWREYQQLSGRESRKALEGLIRDPAFRAASTEEQRNMWDEEVKLARKFARSQLSPLRGAAAGAR